MKKAYSFRLDEELVTRAREEVGPRGFTELVERLLSEHLDNGSGERVSRQEGQALPDSDSATTSRGETTAPPGPPDHVHVWKKNIGSSGLVTRSCPCGAIE